MAAAPRPLRCRDRRAPAYWWLQAKSSLREGDQLCAGPRSRGVERSYSADIEMEFMAGTVLAFVLGLWMRAGHVHGLIA